MGIELPGSVRWVAEKVVGDDWPEGDETAMRRLADDWDASGRTVRELVEDGKAAAARSLDSIEGAAADQLAQRWQAIAGGAGSLKSLLEQCETLSRQLDESATKIEHAKLSIIGALVALAAELIASAAGAPLTFGLSGLAAPAAEAATVVTIRMIISKLILEILDEVLVSVITDVAVEEFAQGVQIVKGDRADLDYGALGATAGDAAITGVFGHAGGVAGDDVAERLTQEAAKKFATSVADGLAEGLATATTDAMPWNAEGGGPSLESTRDAGLTGFLQSLAERERK